MKFMELIQSFLGDEFLSKAFVLSIITGSLVYIRNIPKQIWQRIHRLIFFSIRIEQTDDLFDYTERWIRDNYFSKYRNVIANINYTNRANEKYRENEVTRTVENKNEKENLSYRHNEDILFIRRNGCIIKIDKGRDRLEHAQSFSALFFDSYYFSTFLFKKRLLKLIDEIIEYNQQFKIASDKLVVYDHDGYSGWNRISDMIPKQIKNIILDEEIKTNLIKDIENFTNNRDWYIERSIPYKRGYLFYGSAGNGKTSLSLALSNYLNRKIYTISLSGINSDGDLKNLFNRMDGNSVLLLEDIDSVFNGRKTKDNITFSTLLNCLDGVYYKDGIITIMTTNHIEKLDSALIRDGRVDMQIEFKNPNEELVRNYVNMFYGISLNGEKYNKNYPMAKIQNYCLNSSEKEISKKLFT